MSNYFIIIINNVRKGESEEGDYHLEKVSSIDVVLECLDDSSFYESYSDFLVITNNDALVYKFERALYLREFEMLCRPGRFQKYNTTVSLGFGNYDHVEYLLENVNMLIGINELFSVSMKWDWHSHFPWDDFGPEVWCKEFDGWEYNQKFRFFSTPDHYRGFDSGGILNPPRMSLVDLDKLNDVFHINILNIRNHKFPLLTWSEGDGYLKYYDPVSKIRLYLTKNQLNHLYTDLSIRLVIEMKIDHNYYLEYFVTSLFSNTLGEIEITKKSFWS